MTESKLKELLGDRLLTAGDHLYDEARTVVPGGINRKPRAVCRVRSAEDIASVLSYVRESGMLLSVRGGGHSAPGFGVIDGGIMIDIRSLKKIEVNASDKTAWAQTGLTTAEYTNEAFKYSLATGFGDTGSVGIAGITLGGGIGYFVRKYGLTIDDVLALEVVTADGSVRVADPDHDPDLFWALRGGGGNFGIVTSIKYRMHTIGSIVGGMMVLPATPESISGVIGYAAGAPEGFHAIVNVMTAPPMPFIPKEYYGKPVILMLCAHIGDITQGEKLVAGLKTRIPPIADMVKTIQYPDLYPPEQEGYHPLAAGYTMFLDSVDSDTAFKILKQVSASHASMAVCQLRVLGGAMSRVSPDATAFAHRSSKILTNIAAVYQTPEEISLHTAWTRDFAESIRQSDTGAYVNFLGDEGQSGVRRAYPGKTYDRLAEIKTKYDPDNLFRSNQNILPAT